MSVLSKLFQRRRSPEVRESYTDMVVARIMGASAGESGGGAALAAIETAARLWGAGLSSATLTPSSVALASVTPSVLDSIGRSLCRAGESLHVIDVSGGQVRLIACGSWTVLGSDDPSTWTYVCTLSGPSSTRTVTLPGASVLNVRYSPHPARAWRGRSPLEMAVDTARAAGRLETATSEELSFTQSQILSPRQRASDYGIADTLQPEVIQQIVDAFAKHTNTAALVIPADVQASRLGPTPPDSFADLRDRLENSLLSLHGVPPALVAARGTGTALREAMRQVGASLIRPLGELVGQEIREKLDPAAALDFTALRSADVQGAARAAGSLVKAGYSSQSAADAVGLDVEVSA